MAQAENVSIIPVGVLENHGPQLPLGTDLIYCPAVACAAAEIEPAIVRPIYLQGMSVETKLLPEGIVLRERLLAALLESIFDEISHSGLKEIVLLIGHGGNGYFLPLFAHLLLDGGRNYVTGYVQALDHQAAKAEQLETAVDGHAGEFEPRVGLHCLLKLVQMDEKDPEQWCSPQARLAHIPGLCSPADWAGSVPDHCAGDPRPATTQ